MARRFLIPAGFFAALLGWILCAPSIATQDETAKRPPAAKDAAKNQDPPAKKDAQSSAKPAPDLAAAEAEFEVKFAEWKALIKRLRQLRSDYQTAEIDQRAAMEQDWDTTVAKAQKLLPELIDVVLAAYQAAPNEDRVKTSFLVKVLNDYVLRDHYEPALKIGTILIDNKCDFPDVYRDTGSAAAALNQYPLAIEIMTEAEKKHALASDTLMLRGQLETLQKHWKQEEETRAKEAEADDLPRVKLTTTKGDIIVELFENEAPDTVGNFVNLVRSGYYDTLTFHRVLSGFMAQGGCPEGDGSSGPGYTIYDECTKPGFRRHFRGVLSMAKTGAPHSGGSQFFIAYRALPHLDGQHTVFGRVIEGMDVVNRFQRRNTEDKDAAAVEPERVIKAEVLRDRGHEYVPNKVQ